MHLPSASTIHPAESVAHGSSLGSDGRRFSFLWLELTNRCNLKCVHCYTESSPRTGERDLLTTADYEAIMRQAFVLGCRMLQFIGGEPQLNRDFPHLLESAVDIGFEFIEVFTNLTQLSDEVLRFSARNGVRFATSIYSHDSAAHDAITTVRASHARTVRNLRTLIDNGVETRAGIIVIDQSAAEVEETKEFLRELGVPTIRSSPVREFGRGEEIVGHRAQMTALCGHCWDGKLCIAPDGVAYPCVMAREWPVGNVLETPLAEIIECSRLDHVRKEIYETTWLPQTRQAPQDCTPDMTTCEPDITSCNPNKTFCGPFSCPQSCDPSDIFCTPRYPDVVQPE